MCDWQSISQKVRIIILILQMETNSNAVHQKGNQEYYLIFWLFGESSACL